MKNKKKIAAFLALGGIVAALLTGCATASAPTGMCGWIVGDGTNDRKIHDTIYENTNPVIDSGEEAHYVPCGPRNFVITDGSKKDLDGKPIGDQTTPDTATTKDNTPVKVQLSAYWQLNQSKTAFTDFAELCNKYPCYTTNTDAGESNFATKGWNGMLQENFSPAIQSALNIAMKQIPDTIWQNQDPEEYDQLAKLLAASFMEQVRIPTGYNADLFCGSGNSGWNSDHTAFTCTNVRFKIDNVAAVSTTTQNAAAVKSQADITTEANQSRYASSAPLYGNQTNYWLGVQDAVKACPKGATCNFNVMNPPTQ